MTMSRRFVRSVVAALLLAPLSLQAEEPDSPERRSPGPDAVEVRIGAVLASNSAAEVEPEFDQHMASMRRRFNNVFPYSSYRLVKEQRQRVSWGANVGFDIPGGRYVMVTPKGYKNGRVSLKVVVIDGSRPIVDTSVVMQNRGTFLVAGPREPDGILILSIGAVTVR